MLAALLAFSVCISVRPVLSKLYNDTSELPVGKVYDYIIVGAGTAGGVLGTRLTEDTSKNVLIIEAGSNPDGNINTQVPLFTPNNFGGAVDWNFSSVAQPNLNGRAFKYPVGKTLGGSSSLHLLLYNRGGSDDYDRWANMTGDWGWSWESLYPYYTNRIEHPSSDSDLSQKWVAADHGRTGPLGIGITSFPLPSDPLLINATQELPSEFQFNPDISSGDSIGLGWATTTVENGTRASTWTHYLRPVVGRANLDVVLHTQVTKILQTGVEGGKPAFRGVEFAANTTSPRGTLNATREVILSAGAILSPQLLMLSGIGDSAALSSLGVPTIVNNSNVGQNLQDHPRLSAIYNVAPGTATLDLYKQNTTLRTEEFNVWKTNRTGPFTIASPKQMAFGRNPVNIAPFNASADPSAGPTCGHYQLAFADQFSSFIQPPPTNDSYFTIITNVVSSQSYGNITLNSSSPFSAPLINPAIYSSYYDLATMREGIKAGWRLAQSMSLTSNFIVSPFGPLAAALSAGDTEIEQFAVNGTTVTWHATGTARMASQNGTDGVLDSRLRVLGAAGLRVVDASAIPRTPAANSIAPIYILAERAADLIKADAASS